MPRNPDWHKAIERWIRFKKEEGSTIRDFKGNTCLVNGKKTNIHFASPRKDGTFWFGIGSTQLEDVDVFVLLCEKAENYYAVPRKIMEEIASWRSSQNRYNFRIDITNHEYIAHKRHRIREYYQNNLNSHSPFR